jgi:DNA polymerase-3 subunit epsilon
MPYLIIDLEMSGTEYGFHDIIQIGAVLADDNLNTIAEFSSLVYPKNEDIFSEEAEEIHGISIFDLEGAELIHNVLDSFEVWVRKKIHRKKSDKLNDLIVCGQSIMNDINFLMVEYKEQHLAWPFSYRILDLMSITDLMYRIFDANKIERPKSYSLRNVAKYLKIEILEDKHDALEDARITLQCLQTYFAQIEKFVI